MSEELSQGLDWLVHHLATAGPRIATGARSDRPVIVFTDGACDAEGTTIGGIIYEAGRPTECFGARLSQSLADEWRTKGSQKQVIGQGELYPLLVARLTWASRLRNRRVLYFIDNESARIGLVRAYSPVLPSLKLIQDCLKWDYSNESEGWYARVSSFSNCADAPSRLIRPSPDSGVAVVTPVLPFGHSYDVCL